MNQSEQTLLQLIKQREVLAKQMLKLKKEYARVQEQIERLEQGSFTDPQLH